VSYSSYVVRSIDLLDRGSLTFSKGRSPVKIGETRGLESRIEVK
jgi:hypothetical protein